MEPEDMEERISDMGMEFEETEYAEVHNLIYGALEYAEEAGIDPNPGSKSRNTFSNRMTTPYRFRSSISATTGFVSWWSVPTIGR